LSQTPLSSFLSPQKQKEMGLESLFRTARVKEGSQGTAVLDVEKQEIIEEARITDETDKGIFSLSRYRCHQSTQVILMSPMVYSA
jgi:hypothetical protein